MNTQKQNFQSIAPPSPKLSPTIAPNLQIYETNFFLQETLTDTNHHIPNFIAQDQPATQIPGMNTDSMLDQINEDHFQGKRSYKKFLKGKSCSGIISQVLSYAYENSRPRKRINKTN